jgi:hypothetical protein
MIRTSIWICHRKDTGYARTIPVERYFSLAFPFMVSWSLTDHPWLLPPPPKKKKKKKKTTTGGHL